MSDQYTPTERTRVTRVPRRGTYDRLHVHAILDQGLVCHVGFVAHQRPFVIPTAYARVDEEIYIHGSVVSRMVQTLSSGVDVCLTVTLIDGLVLARSAFHHSINYRSVVVLGNATLVTDPAEKLEALRRFTNHVVPGRWEEVRPPYEQELKATTVLALKLEEVSAKVRTGPPIDDEADRSWPVWAGVVPLTVQAGTPVADEHVLADVEPFDVERVREYDRRTVP